MFIGPWDSTAIIIIITIIIISLEFSSLSEFEFSYYSPPTILLYTLSGAPQCFVGSL